MATDSPSPIPHVAWSDTPPADGFYRPCRRACPATGRLVFISFDAQITGVWTHWVEGRTKPCLGARCFCRKERFPAEPRWKGYLMGIQIPSRELIVAELTADCCQRTAEFHSLTQELRGAEVVLFREGRGFRSPVRAQVALHKYEVQGPPLTCKHALYRIWFGQKACERAIWEKVLTMGTAQSLEGWKADLADQLAGGVGDDVPNP